jgi:membrane protease YdiL (CAAX protease family)
MDLDTGNPISVPSVVSVDEANAASREPRLVWHTVALLCYYGWLVFVTRHPPSRYPHVFRSSTPVVHLVFQWTLWFVAYRGIRSSGLRYKDVVGNFPSSRTAFWSACQDAVFLYAAVWAVTKSLAWLSPFTMRHDSVPRTGFQLFLTLLVAVSAGYTEEVVYRGLMVSQFRILTGSLNAAVFFQALLFALVHGWYQSITQMSEHFIAGLFFAYLAIRRKSLWPSILGHSWIDILWSIRRFARR